MIVAFPGQLHLYFCLRMCCKVNESTWYNLRQLYKEDKFCWLSWLSSPSEKDLP